MLGINGCMLGMDVRDQGMHIRDVCLARGMKGRDACWGSMDAL